MNPFQISKPGKKIKTICSLLGSPYEIKTIDLENVIYRDLGDYDIEVSGLDNQKTQFACDIYVWTKLSGTHVIQTFRGITSEIELKDRLGSIACQYLYKQD